MRIAKAVLLAAVVLAAGAGVAGAADRAGIGLDWGIGPDIAFGNFDMKFQNGFILHWNVSDDFTVGVFNESGSWRGEQKYTDNAATPLKHTMIKGGNMAVNGVRIQHTIPGLSFLLAGLDIGTMSFTQVDDYDLTEGGATITKTTPSAAGTWGTIETLGGVSAMVMGLNGKVSLFKAETKTVTTDINILASMRFVPMADKYVFGSSEALKTTPKKIDVVNSFNNLLLLVGVGIGF